MKVERFDWDMNGTKAWRFWCPGCDQSHAFIEGRWSFNGDAERPTFSPSILVRGTNPLTDEEYQTLRNGGKIVPRDFVCHSFVTDGRIQFLSDCTHGLAGQTVDIPDLETI